MHLSELFRQLSLVELSNLATGNDGDGTIRTADHARVTVMVNDALQALYKRFIIKEKILLLEQQEGRAFYTLHSDYAASNSGTTSGPHYIEDTSEPFTDDLIRILDVADYYGRRYRLNEEMHELSIFTPEFNVLQIPRPEAGVLMAIEYQAKHALLSESELTGEIELPDVLLPALRQHVAGAVYSNVNTPESVATGQRHMMQYENLCLEIEQKEILPSTRNQVLTKFENRGFV